MKRINLKPSKLFLLVPIVVLLFALFFFGEKIYKEQKQKSQEAIEVERSNQWEIVTAMPVDGAFTLKIQNKKFDLIELEKVLAYQISNGKDILAYVTGEGLFIYDLNLDTKKKAVVDFTIYTLATNQKISWSANDTYAAILLKSDELNSAILVFNNNAELVKQYSVPGYFAGNEVAFSPFKENEDMFIVRSIWEQDLRLKKEDGSNYSLMELPAFLSIYEILSDIKSSLRLSDIGTMTDKLFFRWHPTIQNYVQYNFEGSPLKPLATVKL